MKLLPLHHHAFLIGHAQVDDAEWHELTQFRFGIQLPKSLRKQFPRSDLILIGLREEPELLHLCTPWVQSFGLTLRLFHLILRPTILRLLCELHSYPHVRKDLICNLIQHELTLTPRITYADGSRTNLQRSNLRELNPEAESGLP